MTQTTRTRSCDASPSSLHVPGLNARIILLDGPIWRSGWNNNIIDEIATENKPTLIVRMPPASRRYWSITMTNSRCKSSYSKDPRSRHSRKVRLKSERFGPMGPSQIWGGPDWCPSSTKTYPTMRPIRLIFEQVRIIVRLEEESKNFSTFEPSTSWSKDESRRLNWNSKADWNKFLPESLTLLSPKRSWSVSFRRSSQLHFWLLVQNEWLGSTHQALSQDGNLLLQRSARMPNNRGETVHEKYHFEIRN